MSEGYIKLYRQILDNPIVCKDSDHFAVWCYLLLSATHSEMEVMFNGKKITLKKGQLITGRKSIVKVFNLSESKVQRILKSFEIEQQIEQQTTPNGRLITVLNWDMYQANEQPNEQRVNNDRTTNEQRVNTNKNVKNVKNVKKDITIRDLLVDFSPEFQSAFMDYSEMRTKIKKPLTARAAQMALSKLQELSKSEAEQIAIINQSVFHSWQGLFELKERPQQQNQSAGYGYEGMDKL